MPTPQRSWKQRFLVILGWSLRGGTLGTLVGSIPLAFYRDPPIHSPSGGYGNIVLVPLLIFCCLVGTIIGTIIGFFQTSERLRARSAYDWLVRLVISIGIVTFVGGLCSLLILIGSEPFWMNLLVTAGPLAILTCGLIALRSRYWGAGTMIMAALFTAECGIRASLMPSGFDDQTAFFVILCVSAPMVLVAGMLLLFGGRYSLRTLLISVAIASILVGGIYQRFIHVRQSWNATLHRGR